MSDDPTPISLLGFLSLLAICATLVAIAWIVAR